MTWLLGIFANFIRTPEAMIPPIPERVSFEVAASPPAIHVTAYHGLVNVARLSKGESILIHSAAGGLGQATAMLAQHLQAEIFVTISSDVKKELTMTKYGIAEDHIFNSRDLTFVESIKRMTNGRGVNVVLNSLAGEILRQTWHCLAWSRRFGEVAKRDMAKSLDSLDSNVPRKLIPFSSWKH